MIRSSSIVTVLLYLIAFLALSQVPDSDDDVPRELIDGVIYPEDNNVSAKGTLKDNQNTSDSIDFGFVGSCIIGGRLWIDEIENDTEKENGIQNEDLNTSGISGVEMTLKMNLNGNWIPVRKNITAKGTGKYIFEDLFEGEYLVEIGDHTKSPDIIKGRGWYKSTKFYRANNFINPEKYDCNDPNDTISLWGDNCTKNLNIDFAFDHTG